MFDTSQLCCRSSIIISETVFKTLIPGSRYLIQRTFLKHFKQPFTLPRVIILLWCQSSLIYELFDVFITFNGLTNWNMPKKPIATIETFKICTNNVAFNFLINKAAVNHSIIPRSIWSRCWFFECVGTYIVFILENCETYLVQWLFGTLPNNRGYNGPPGVKDRPPEVPRNH